MRRHLLVALWLVASVATAPAAPLVTTPAAPGSSIFGTGADGNVSCSSGTITLTRDMDYRNLTISGTCSIIEAGWRVFVAGTLDISNAGAGAIKATAAVTTNASGATGGSTPGSGTGAATQLPTVSQAANNFGGFGGSGNTTTGASAPNSGNPSYVANGGTGGNGGAGGNSTSAGQAGSLASAPYNQDVLLPNPTASLDANIFYGSTKTPIVAGMIGGGGGAGGGDGTNSGGGGGGAGKPGGWVYIAARYISRGVSTAAGAISAAGGTGGNGAAGTAGNAAAGAGGGGGGGGAVYLIAQALLGSTATNAIDVSGGNGGNGGLGAGTGTAGAGARAGYGGNYQIIVLDPASFTVGPFGIAPTSAPSGTTGGVAAVVQGNL